MESIDTFRGVATRPSSQRFRPAAIALSSWVILSAGAGGLACNVVLGIDDATLCGDCDGGAPVLEARTPLSPPDSDSSSGDPSGSEPPGNDPPGSEPPGSEPPGPIGTGAGGAAPSGPGPAAMTGTGPGAPTAPALPPEPIDSSSGSATPDAGSSEDDGSEEDTAEEDTAEDDAAEDDAAEDDAAEEDTAEEDTAEDDTAEEDGSESNACTPGTTRCIDASTVGACDTTGQVEISIGCGLLEGCQAGVCSLLGL